MLSTEQLSKIGLHGKVAQFYLAALELGEAPVFDIAKQAGIGRTTAYNLLARLQEDGLVSQVQKAGRTYVIAERPDVLLRKHDEKKRHLTDILPELLSLYGHSVIKPTVRYYEGSKGILNVLYDTLTCRNRQLKAILSAVEMVTTPGLKEMEIYIKQRIAAGIRLNVLRSPAEEVGTLWPSTEVELREVRYAKVDGTFAMTMYIYDEKVAVISSRRENFGMIIESLEFSRLQESLFNVLWAVSEPA